MLVTGQKSDVWCHLSQSTVNGTAAFCWFIKVRTSKYVKRDNESNTNPKWLLVPFPSSYFTEGKQNGTVPVTHSLDQ